ncbi:hypothetical protein BDZ45DRAFT_451939 [Acephala macrosclerotiorum]|nr:hypothetical protein BDZ45DRAFT_451939 [Acephala macrosclerotiorum]
MIPPGTGYLRAIDRKSLAVWPKTGGTGGPAGPAGPRLQEPRRPNVVDNFSLTNNALVASHPRPPYSTLSQLAPPASPSTPKCQVDIAPSSLPMIAPDQASTNLPMAPGFSSRPFHACLLPLVSHSTSVPVMLTVSSAKGHGYA